MAAEFLVSGPRRPLAEQRRRGRCHVWLPGGGEAGEDGSGGGRKGSVTEPGGGTVHGARSRSARKPSRLFFFFFLAWACAMGNGTLAQALDVLEWLSGYPCVLSSAHFAPVPRSFSLLCGVYFGISP